MHAYTHFYVKYIVLCSMSIPGENFAYIYIYIFILTLICVGKETKPSVCNYYNYRKPGLSPGGNTCYTTMIKNPFSCFCTSMAMSLIMRSNSKDAHADVVQCSAEHGTVTLYVQSPSAIFVLR